jgi:hypothetical protein
MLKAWHSETENQADRDSMIDRRMIAVTGYSLDAGWPIAKREGVADLARRRLAPMPLSELAMMTPTELQELVERAARSYDRIVLTRSRPGARDGLRGCSG